MDNSISKGSWNLYVRFSRIDETEQQAIPIAFEPSGKIDYTKTSVTDLELINRMLEPVVFATTDSGIRKGGEVRFLAIGKLGVCELLLDYVSESRTSQYDKVCASA